MTEECALGCSRANRPTSPGTMVSVQVDVAAGRVMTGYERSVEEWRT